MRKVRQSAVRLSSLPVPRWKKGVLLLREALLSTIRMACWKTWPEGVAERRGRKAWLKGAAERSGLKAWPESVVGRRGRKAWLEDVLAESRTFSND